MAGKFIELKEAAKQLGITPERLLELRESGEVHGYRDGATWKFKVEEIERVASSLQPTGSSEDIGASDSAPFGSGEVDPLLDLSSDSDSDESLDGSSILISEEPKGKAEGGSSTVIGKGDSEQEKEDSDLKLADEAPDSGDSDVALVPEKNGDSDVKVVAEEAKAAGPSDSDLKLADDEDLSDELELSSELDFDSDDALILGEDSELKLEEEEEEISLEDSSDSEVPIGESDAGMALSSPSDSGISLESEPQGADSSSGALELPEDDEMISLEDDLVASPDDATQLQQDEEFLLSPSDEMLGDESSDSGSQVIALEESDSISDEAVGVADSEEAILEPEETEALEAQLETFEGATAVEAGAAPLGVGELPEAPYTIGNIIALLTIILLLTVTGMLMTDVIRNMWAWNGAGTTSSTIADAIVSLLRMQ